MLPDGSLKRCPVAPTSACPTANGEGTEGSTCASFRTDVLHCLAARPGHGRAVPPAAANGEAADSSTYAPAVIDVLTWLSGQALRRGLGAHRRRKLVLCAAACASP